MKTQHGYSRLVGFSDGTISLGIMTIAFVIAVVFPSIGLWGLALFVLSNPLQGALARRKRVTG